MWRIQQIGLVISVSVWAANAGKTTLFDCSNDFDCQPNSYCYGSDATVPGKCKCTDEFGMNRKQTTYECLKVKYVGDYCETNLQCQLSDSNDLAFCNDTLKTCVCHFGSYDNSGICYLKSNLDETCEQDKNCYLGNGTHALCKNSTCQCHPDQVVSQDKMRCLSQKKLGESCEVNEQCASTTTNSLCSSTTCVCDQDYIEDKNKTACFKVVKQLGEECKFDEQCSTGLPGTVCSSSKCTCQSNSREYNNKCVQIRKLGEACDNDDECAETKNSFCSEICKCTNQYTESRNVTVCVKVADKLGDECEFDGQCKKFLGSECITGHCKCSNDFTTYENKCNRITKNAKSSNSASSTKNFLVFILFLLFIQCLV